MVDAVFVFDTNFGSAQRARNSELAAAASASSASASATSAAASASSASASAASAAVSATKFFGTSTTSNSIGAVGQSRTFTTEANKGFVAGAEILVFVTGDTSTRMTGVVTAYDTSTGVLTFTIDSSTGVGTFDDWQLRVTGDPGQQGIEGPAGSGNVERVRFCVVNADLATIIDGASYDGVSIQAGDVFVAPRQADPSENGIYTVASGSPSDPTRHVDFDTADSMCGLVVSVQGGTLYGGTLWQGVSPVGGTIDSSPVLFDQRDGPDLGPYTVTTGISQALDQTGKFAVAHDPATGPAIIIGDRPPSLPGLSVWVGMGQSQMATSPGDNSAIPSIHKVPIRPYRFLMFDACNLYGLGSQDITGLDLTKIVAAHERISESLATGIFTQLIDYEDTNRIANRARLWLNVARGGADYNHIKFGQLPFSNALNGLQALVDRFGAGSVTCEGVILEGLESNCFDSADDVLAMVYELYDDINSTAHGLRFVTGQTPIIPLYIAHFPFITAPRNAGDGPLDAFITAHDTALSDDSARRTYVMASEYQQWFPSSVHMGSRSLFDCGAAFGQSIAELIYEQGNGVFWPQSATIDGNDIVVATNAESNLVYDTTTVPDRGNAGFVVTDADGVTKTISAVAVSSTNVRITMSTTPAVGWIVKYARTDTRTSAAGPGGRGNIRDSRTTTIALDATPLYQWMLSYNITVSA